jgi:uncharacterized protein (TIGR02996 family)
MPDQGALFRAILAAPDDEALRLIYADWLEDQGDPRAEFVRVQCALARLPEGHPERTALAAREAHLLAAHRRRWNGELHRLLSRTPLRNAVPARRGLVRGWTYRRGLVEEITVEARAFLDHAATLFQLGPLREVRFFRGAAPHVRQLSDMPHLARLVCLDFSGNALHGDPLRALLASPHLQPLTALRLRGCFLDDEDVQSIVAASHLQHLAELDLRFNWIGRRGVQALRAAGNLRQVLLNLTGSDH